MIRRWYYRWLANVNSFHWIYLDVDANDLVAPPISYIYWISTETNINHEQMLALHGSPTTPNTVNPNVTFGTGGSSWSVISSTNPTQGTWFDQVSLSPVEHEWQNEEGLLKVKERRYDTPADVRMRLHDSIVRFKGVPVLVSAVPDSLKVQLTFITEPERKRELVDSSSDDLDISSPPLGYTNTNKSYLDFIYRNTYRQQKQGVNRDNCLSIQEYYDKSEGEIKQARGRSFDDFVAIGNTILDKYPDIDKCLTEIKKSKVPGRAFHRSYALIRCSKSEELYKLKFKTNTMGIYIPKEALALIRPEYMQDIHEQSLSKFMKLEKAENDNSI